MTLRKIGIRQDDEGKVDKGLQLLKVFGFILQGSNDILTDREAVNQCKQHWNAEVLPYLKEHGVCK